MDESRSVSLDRAKRRLGTVLRDKWQIHALLGVGGMAAVYSATHRNGKRAAVKVLHPEFCAQPQFVSRFLREGYVANKIEHPASVAVLDDDVAEDGTVFLVMDLLEGHSLDVYTRRNDPRRLPLDRILAMADEVLDLLVVAHAQGIIHRDLKPGNIFLTIDERVKVLDFGIARLAERTLDASATQTGAAMGTPAYMPPEQARGRWNLVDSRSDLWALGATVFALIAGGRPRRAETIQEELLLAMTAPLPSLAVVAPSCPKDVVAWVDRAVAFEMEGRWPDPTAMQSALREIMKRDELRGSPPATAQWVVDTTVQLDAPSQSSAPRPDTAPVLLEGARRSEPSTHLTSGATLNPPRSASRRWVALTTAMAVALVGGALLVRSGSRVSEGPTAAAHDPPAPVVSAPPATSTLAPPPPLAVEPGTPGTQESANAPPTLPDPAPPATSTGSRSAHSKAPGASGPQPPPKVPAPPSKAKPAPTVSDNPLDQRF